MRERGVRLAADSCQNGSPAGTAALSSPIFFNKGLFTCPYSVQYVILHLLYFASYTAIRFHYVKVG